MTMMDQDEEKYQGYYLPPALGEQIKKAVAQVGILEALMCAPHFLLFLMG